MLDGDIPQNRKTDQFYPPHLWVEDFLDEIKSVLSAALLCPISTSSLIQSPMFDRFNGSTVILDVDNNNPSILIVVLKVKIGDDYLEYRCESKIVDSNIGKNLVIESNVVSLSSEDESIDKSICSDLMLKFDIEIVHQICKENKLPVTHKVLIVNLSDEIVKYYKSIGYKLSDGWLEFEPVEI